MEMAALMSLNGDKDWLFRQTADELLLYYYKQKCLSRL